MFCECGGLIIGKKGIAECRSCGKKFHGRVELKSSKEEKKEEIKIIEDNAPNLALTDMECPKCGNDKAYFALIQTRSMDEPPTHFYKCNKCNKQVAKSES